MKRDTKQRVAIKAALQRNPQLLRSPMELLTEAQQSVPNLGIATVYRNLRTMQASGEIRAVPMPGEADRYQLASEPRPTRILTRPDGTVINASNIPLTVSQVAERYRTVTYCYTAEETTHA